MLIYKVLNNKHGKLLKTKEKITEIQVYLLMLVKSV